MTEEEGAVPQRESGWLWPILATLLFLILPATPLLRLLVPVDRSILLLAPALAVCAVAGWRAGGRWTLALFWTLVAGWVLFQPGGAEGDFALLARGWGAILAATFGALVMGGVGERFLPRALMAIGIALGVGGLVTVIASGGLSAAADLVAAELARRAEFSQTQWREMVSSDEWVEFFRESQGAEGMRAEVERQMVALPPFGRMLLPALLALESLAALALAWAVYHRVGRARLGPPLSRWRDLRFDDTLVWGVVVGLLVLALPTVFTGMARAVGANMLLFFGALYALRGLGVLIWFLAPGRWMSVFLTVFALFFWYVVGVVSVGVGLGDTWFDWRRRVRPKSQRSE